MPDPLAALIRRQADPGARGHTADAWALLEELSQVARQVFGPPRYVPFHMPPEPR